MKAPFVTFLIVMLLHGCSENESKTNVSNIDFNVTYYPDSAINEIVQKRNGLLEGKAFKFTEQGAKLWEFYYKNDQQEGMQYYYYNHGKLNVEIPYKNGKQHGWAKRYTGPCGSISEEGQYENGEKSGLWYEYYDNEILEVSFYKSDSLIRIVYRNNKYPDRNILLPKIRRDCAD